MTQVQKFRAFSSDRQAGVDGSDAEYQLVDSRSVALKPKSLSMVQEASMPLTWITAWEALIERMEIKEGEDSGILIINGSGGVRFVASQIARTVLHLPVVVTTTSREETTNWSKSMGATHTVNHRENLVDHIRALNLPVAILYIFITYTPVSQYMKDSAATCAPFGKVCSIVQDREIHMYRTEWMAESSTFVWCLLGTKPYYGLDLGSHGKILKNLALLVDEGKIKRHHIVSLPLTVEGLRRAHGMIEEGGEKGKIRLRVDVEGAEGRAFA